MSKKIMVDITKFLTSGTCVGDGKKTYTDPQSITDIHLDTQDKKIRLRSGDAHWQLHYTPEALKMIDDYFVIVDPTAVKH